MPVLYHTKSINPHIPIVSSAFVVTLPSFMVTQPFHEPRLWRSSDWSNTRTKVCGGLGKWRTYLVQSGGIGVGRFGASVPGLDKVRKGARLRAG